jgi:hypothetical protein
LTCNCFCHGFPQIIDYRNFKLFINHSKPMKKLIFSSAALAAILFLFSSCAQETKTELTDKQKEVIIDEVKQVFEYILGGIENRDAERAFSAFTKNTKLLQEGYIITDLEKEKNGYKENFSKPGPKTKVTCDPLYFDILDANTVLVTTIGSIASIENTNPAEQPWVIAYTMLFKKESEGWKVHNMHMSWK